MASEVSVLGDEQEESMEALSRDLERSAISPDSTLYQPSSSQEEKQSTTDDSISQAMCAQYPRPPDNTDEGKVAALQWFVDECSIGPLGSIRKRPWSEATSKTHDCYTRKASEIIAEVLKTHSGSPCLPEGWAGRESAKPRHRFNSKQKRYLEGKFKHGETMGVKANPDDVSKEMRCLRDENGKRIFTVEEFLCPQQIFLFFSRMACKRRDATESDDEAEEFARKQAAVHSDVMEALQQKITHPLLFSGKNLCLMTESEIESLKMTQMHSMVGHFSIKVKGRKKEAYRDAIIAFLNRCSCKQ